MNGFTDFFNVHPELFMMVYVLSGYFFAFIIAFTLIQIIIHMKPVGSRLRADRVARMTCFWMWLLVTFQPLWYIYVLVTQDQYRKTWYYFLPYALTILISLVILSRLFPHKEPKLKNQN